MRSLVFKIRFILYRSFSNYAGKRYIGWSFNNFYMGQAICSSFK